MFFVDRYYGYDDGLYVVCRLLEIVFESGHSLSHQLAGIPPRGSTPQFRVASPAGLHFKVISKVTEIIREHHQTVDVDGVRVPFANGWGLVRASNTQPVLVMRFEATSEELLDRYRHEIEQSVERAKQELGAA